MLAHLGSPGLCEPARTRPRTFCAPSGFYSVVVAERRLGTRARDEEEPARISTAGGEAAQGGAGGNKSRDLCFFRFCVVSSLWLGWCVGVLRFLRITAVEKKGILQDS